MASNPAEIMGQAQALVPNAGEQMLHEQMGRLQLQGAHLQLQAQQQQLQQAQTAFHRQQTFGHDMQGFIANPTPQGLATLYGNYPEFQKQASDAWGALDEGRKRTDLTQLGSVAALTARGDYAGAAKLMEQRIAADKAAGHDSSDDEQILDHLNSPDPAHQKAATAMVSMALGGAMGPKEAADFLEANGLSNKPYTLAQGETRYGGDNQPVASVAPKPDYLIIPEGGKAVPVGPSAPQTGGAIQGNPAPTGGGGPASTGGVGGIAPAAQAVASTLASGGMPAPVVAGFMGNFHAEGGWTGAQGDGGSASGIAQLRGERRDNFTRMFGKDPKDALPEDQAKFTLWEMQNPVAAGMTVAQRDQILAAKTPAQAAALIERFYERPRASVAGSQARMAAATAFANAASPSAPSAPQAPQAQPGDPAGTIYGNAKPGYTLLTSQQAESQGLNPSKTWQRGPDGQTTAVGDAPAAIAPGDTSKTGPEYVASLPTALANRVRGILAGKLPYPPQGRSTNNSIIAALSQAAPGFDATVWQRRRDTVNAYAPGGVQGKSLISAKTLINHLYEMAQASDKLGGGRFTPFNALHNMERGVMSDPDLIRYNESNKFVSTEGPKFIGGKAPTQEEIFREIASRSPSIGAEGRKTALQTDMNYIFGRLQPMLDAYHDAMGANFDIDRAIPGGVVTDKIAALENWANGGKLAPPSRTMGTHPPGQPGTVHATLPPGAHKVGTHAGQDVYEWTGRDGKLHRGMMQQ